MGELNIKIEMYSLCVVFSYILVAIIMIKFIRWALSEKDVNTKSVELLTQYYNETKTEEKIKIRALINLELLTNYHFLLGKKLVLEMKRVVSEDN